MQNLFKEQPDICEWDDYSLYEQSKDPEYMQYLERKNVLLSACATGRYSCLPGGKHNLSKDYYEAHLTDRVISSKWLKSRRFKERVSKGNLRRMEKKEATFDKFSSIFKKQQKAENI